MVAMGSQYLLQKMHRLSPLLLGGGRSASYGAKNTVNNGRKGHIHQPCKTRQKSKVVKLTECYGEWWREAFLLFHLEKSPGLSLGYFGNSNTFLHA